METLRIIGLTLETYDQTYSDVIKFEIVKNTRTATRYYLYAKNVDDGTLCRILLDEDYNSEDGWAEDCFGIMKKEPIVSVPKLSYVPINESIIEINFEGTFFECSLFTFSLNGGVNYYSDGYIKVHMDKFQEVAGKNTKSARNVL